MNPQSKAREYFLADSHLKTETGQEFRIAGTFPESSILAGNYIHVIEHSAFVRLQDELEYTKRLLADERSGDCDKDKTIRRLERNLNNALSENAILREALEFYANESNWKTIEHCEGDKLSKIRTQAEDYDSYGYSENGEASRLMVVAGKKARQALEKVKSERAEAE